MQKKKILTNIELRVFDADTIFSEADIMEEFENARSKGFFNLRLDYGVVWDTSSLTIRGDRFETDKECEARQKRSKAARKAAKAFAGPRRALRAKVLAKELKDLEKRKSYLEKLLSVT